MRIDLSAPARSHLYKNTYRIPSTRLSSWNYGTPGGYFVTICTKDRVQYFGDVVDGKMQLSAIGQIAEQSWQEIPDHCENVRIDEYVVMPNHVHGILFIERRLDNDDGKNNNEYFPTMNNDNHSDLDNSAGPVVETFHGTSLPDSPPRDHLPRGKLLPPNGSLSLSHTMSAISPKRGSLGAIVRSYKSSVTRYCRQNGYSHFAWQSRFYEHVIRADGSIDYIRRYIVNNPKNWQRDQHNVQKSPPPT